MGHPEGSGVQPQKEPPHAGTNPPCCHPVLPSPHQLQLEGERHSSSSHKCFSYPSAWANTLKHHRYKLTLYWVSCHPTNSNSAEHEINPPGIAFPGKTPGVPPVAAIPGNLGTSQRPCHLRNPGRDPRPPLGWGKAGGASTTPIPPAKSSASFPPGSSSPPPALPSRLRFAPCSFPTPWALGELAHHPPGRGRGTPAAQPGGRLMGVPKISQREGKLQNKLKAPRMGWPRAASAFLPLHRQKSPLPRSPASPVWFADTSPCVPSAPRCPAELSRDRGRSPMATSWSSPHGEPLLCWEAAGHSSFRLFNHHPAKGADYRCREKHISGAGRGNLSSRAHPAQPTQERLEKMGKIKLKQEIWGQHRQQAALGMNQRNPGFAGRLGAPHICTPL